MNLTFVLGAQKNRLVETVLLSTHNICFDLQIRKVFFNKVLLPNGLNSRDFPEIMDEIILLYSTSAHSRHYIVIFEALFITVKVVLLKPYLSNSTTFIKSADIYTVIIP